MNRTMVVIKRDWNNPEIKIRVTQQDISLEIGLDDFLIALTEEAGNPMPLLTKERLKNRLLNSSLEVIRKIKEESVKAV